ncbi:PepSY-associated TM helix domain-containing protein [Paludibacterium yongneupense]|uniref:PepSY-associated TM helix domain-containing protein n=1 Tax=Paludibacterium yongneupense TaxID=400061 RepID=UPI00041632BB|nr:PepSY-associated TM helix domain-containing protein [Paludibacterium yongneupense]
MRPLLLKLHRYFGLAAAAFLFAAGGSGALIAWHEELDAWLNPGFFHARTQGTPLPAAELIRRVEAADPRISVRYLPLTTRPGDSLIVQLDARINPADGRPYRPGYDQVALDPVSGAVLGKRLWGEVAMGREHLIPLLYRLHYTLLLPVRHGVDLGVWLMGLIAIGWLFDSIVSLCLAFPSPRSWRKSFALRWREGGYRLLFDLHRSGGVWLWGVLTLLALTSVAMNLREEVVRPVLSLFSTPTPSPLRQRGQAPSTASVLPPERILALAAASARLDRIADPAGGLYIARAQNLYGVGFFPTGEPAAGMGATWLYFNAASGAVLGAEGPGRGNRGDRFLQAMFPLHSGRLFGLAGRVAISLTGVAVAILSASGVLIWLKKRRARQRSARRRMENAA